MSSQDQKLYSTGFTMIEILISYTLLAGLLIMVITAIVAAGRPMSDTTTRSYIESQGAATMSSVSLELESSFLAFPPDDGGTNPNFGLGTLTVPSTFVGRVTDFDTGTGQVFMGRAIQFRRVTGWDAGTDSATLDPVATDPELIYAFVSDESNGGDGVDNDGDGLIDELKLVRVVNDTLVIDLQSDIVNNTFPPTPASPAPQAETPYFRLLQPGDLEIAFTVRRQVDFDTNTNQRVFAQVEFTQNVNLRNMNQP